MRNRSHERRRDHATADVVDVALLYLEVFGLDATRRYLAMTDLPAAISERILQEKGALRQG